MIFVKATNSQEGVNSMELTQYPTLRAWKSGNFQFKVKLNNTHTLGEINRKSMNL